MRVDIWADISSLLKYGICISKAKMFAFVHQRELRDSLSWRMLLEHHNRNKQSEKEHKQTIHDFAVILPFYGLTNKCT